MLAQIADKICALFSTNVGRGSEPTKLSKRQLDSSADDVDYTATKRIRTETKATRSGLLKRFHVSSVLKHFYGSPGGIMADGATIDLTGDDNVSSSDDAKYAVETDAVKSSKRIRPSGKSTDKGMTMKMTSTPAYNFSSAKQTICENAFQFNPRPSHSDSVIFKAPLPRLPIHDMQESQSSRPTKLSIFSNVGGNQDVRSSRSHATAKDKRRMAAHDCFNLAEKGEYHKLLQQFVQPSGQTDLFKSVSGLGCSAADGSKHIYAWNKENSSGRLGGTVGAGGGASSSKLQNGSNVSAAKLSLVSTARLSGTASILPFTGSGTTSILPRTGVSATAEYIPELSRHAILSRTRRGSGDMLRHAGANVSESRAGRPDITPRAFDKLLQSHSESLDRLFRNDTSSRVNTSFSGASKAETSLNLVNNEWVKEQWRGQSTEDRHRTLMDSMAGRRSQPTPVSTGGEGQHRTLMDSLAGRRNQAASGSTGGTPGLRSPTTTPSTRDVILLDSPPGNVGKWTPAGSAFSGRKTSTPSFSIKSPAVGSFDEAYKNSKVAKEEYLLKFNLHTNKSFV